MTRKANKATKATIENQVTNAIHQTYERQVKRNLRYMELAQRKIEASKTKHALAELRRDWIQNAKKINYQNEYQRLIGDLQHSQIQGRTTENIKRRMKHLEQLADQSLGRVGMSKKDSSLDYNALMERLAN